MPSRRPSAAAHLLCPFSGAATLRASHQSQPADKLPFRVSTPISPCSPSLLGWDHQIRLFQEKSKRIPTSHKICVLDEYYVWAFIYFSVNSGKSRGVGCCVVVFFALTDRASTITSCKYTWLPIRHVVHRTGKCQSTSTKLQ